MKRRAPTLALIAAAALTGVLACDELPTDSEPENTPPTAVAAADDSSPLVGTTVTVDATGSSDADGDVLSYGWSATGPSGTGKTMSAPQSATTTFDADEVGSYTIELVVSDGEAADTAVVTITATNGAPSAVALPADTTVATGTTVMLDGTGSGDPDGQTLTFSWTLEAPAGSGAAITNSDTMEPSFTADVVGEYRAILTVSDGYATSADTTVVTAVEPGDPPVIVATGTEGAIAFDVAHTVFVEATDPDGDALSYEWRLIEGTGSLYFPDTIFDSDTTQVAVTGAGAYLVEVQVSDGFNTVADTLEFQAYSPVVDDIGVDTTLVDLLNADYTAAGNVTVTGGLTVEPGVTVRFPQAARLIVSSGGSLNAVGTVEDTIRFLGQEPSAGYWDGIEVGTVNAANELGYVEVAHGGSGGYDNVWVTTSGSVAIHDSRIHTSSEAGVGVNGAGLLEGFSSNTLHDNAGGAVVLPANAVGHLDAASSYGDAGSDRIIIAGGTTTSAQTWPAADIPFHLAENAYIESAVIVEPGATFRAASAIRLLVRNGGSLTAVGTASDTIRFLGEQASAGYWDGIEILTTNAANELSYVEAAHGGSAGYGTVDVAAGGSLSLSHSRIHTSADGGLEVAHNGQITAFAENTFANNAGGAVRLYVPALGSLDNASTYAGGDTGNFIAVFEGTSTGAQTWPATDAPIRLEGNAYVESAVTVEPGAEFHGAQAIRLIVRNGGSLNAVGTEADTIRFVGAQDSPGYWDGIEVLTVDAENQLVYTEVANGGSGGYSNVWVSSSGQVALANSLFRNSSSHGVVVKSGGQLVGFSANTFAGNTGSALLVPAEEIGALDGASTYAGANGSDVISTDGGTVSSTQTWPSTDAPILFLSTATVESGVTIEAGADLEFGQSVRLIVGGTNGEITAVGTATDTITFHGAQAAAGYWDGIDVQTANANVFDYVDVGYGGSSGYANIYIRSSGAATVTNSLIHDSSGWGIEVVSTGVLNTDGSNTYSNNGSGSSTP